MMETASLVLKSIQEDDFMASVDVKGRVFSSSDSQGVSEVPLVYLLKVVYMSRVLVLHLKKKKKKIQYSFFGRIKLP